MRYTWFEQCIPTCCGFLLSYQSLPDALSTVAENAPAVRAGVAIDGLNAMKALPEGAAILEAMDPNVARLLKEVSRNGWLPIEVDLEIMRAASSVVGVEKMRALGLESVRRSAETPLLKPVIRGITTLFRVNVHGVVRMIKRTISSLYRDIGTFTPVNEGDEKAALVWEKVPAELLSRANLPWLEGLAGGFEMAFRICQVQGTLTLVPTKAEVSAAANGLRFEFEWEKSR